MHERNGVLDRAGRTLGFGALAVALLGSTALVCHTVIRIKADRRDYAVEVTGSAKRTIVATQLAWTGTVTMRVARTAEGHAALERVQSALAAFFEARGLPAQEVRFSAVDVDELRELDARKVARLVGYQLTLRFSISTQRRDALQHVAASSAELIAAAGIEGGEYVWRPGELRYVYPQLDSLKQEVLAEATRNGRVRAQAIARASSHELGLLRQAELGDIQIRSPGSSSRYSDDDSTPTKEIVADVKVLYHLR